MGVVCRSLTDLALRDHFASLKPLAISITRLSRCWIAQTRGKPDRQCLPVWLALTRSEPSLLPVRCWSGSGIGGPAVCLGLREAFSRVTRILTTLPRTPFLSPAPRGIARGRRWVDEAVSGRVMRVAELGAREKCSVRQVNMTILLAFLAPNLVKAAVEGRLPRGIGVERLRDPPTEWSQQFEALGLNPE